MQGHTLRATFLDFFRKNGHTIVPSASLIPLGDPSLLLTNAGMVPFKRMFTGQEPPPAPRVASSQRCLRAGGKHNDLEAVGHTARHLTFFEMLGNFSFGDYFKEEAIVLAWKFLRTELDLPPERLLITIHAEDEEAGLLWKKVTGFPDHKILPLATGDNFWTMGKAGPCGPCSEVFYDHGPSVSGGVPGTEEGDRYMEIWNLVFMQDHIDEQGTKTSLPQRAVDTGMGLERISTVLQGVKNVFDTDLLSPLVLLASQLTKQPVSHGHYVAADHTRAAAFLIADGVLPSNEGRGYVLRRVVRRAIRYLHQAEYIMPQLADHLVEQMHDAYPELLVARSLIGDTLKAEEARFTHTLERGMALLNQRLSSLSETSLDGRTAFFLYDTYGFPLELTADVAREHGKTVDLETFKKCMHEQKERGRSSRKSLSVKEDEALWHSLQSLCPATLFLGYHVEEAKGKVLSLVSAEGEEHSLHEGDKAILVLDQTPFYGESGGQVGDTGTITGPKGTFRVEETHIKGSLYAHVGVLERGVLEKGSPVTAVIQSQRRHNLAVHHSAAHLLHAALRHVLGAHVMQRGSLVSPDGLRFDFSHNTALTPQDIQKIEDTVNTYIWDNASVDTELVPKEEALHRGALALFGEKYGEEVRMVSMGSSSELCGGTHVHRTGNIGLFTILRESSIAAGVRRVEALAGARAFEVLRQKSSTLETVASRLHTPAHEVIHQLDLLLTRDRTQTRELESYRHAMHLDALKKKDIRQVNGIPFRPCQLTHVDSKRARELVTDLLKEEDGVVALVVIDHERATLFVGVSKAFHPPISAVTLARHGGERLGGKGGGKPHFAQAGGPRHHAAQEALVAVEELLNTYGEGHS